MKFFRCPRCGELFAAETLPIARCAACGALLRVAAVPRFVKTAVPVALSPEDWQVPWEARANASAVVRLLATLRLILRSAPRFFFFLDDSTPAAAERFAYLVSLIGIAGYFAAERFFLGESAGELSQMMRDSLGPDFNVPSPEAITRLFTVLLIASPVLAALPAHVFAGLYQAGLFLLGLPNRGYHVTFRVAAYGLAPMLLLAIPGLGFFLAPGWILALHWVGLSAGQRLSLPLSAVAMAIPLLAFLAIFGTVLGKLMLAWLSAPI